MFTLSSTDDKNCFIYRSAIQKQIRTSSAVRKFVALLFLKISFTYMEARRIYEVDFLVSITSRNLF